jgi:hypothetical protein
MNGSVYGQRIGERTLFKFPNNLAYSSRTSCSSGESVSLSRSAPDVWEAEKCASWCSDAMLLGFRLFLSEQRSMLGIWLVCVRVAGTICGCVMVLVGVLGCKPATTVERTVEGIRDQFVIL